MEISNCVGEMITAKGLDARRHQAPGLTESRFVTFVSASDTTNIHRFSSYRPGVRSLWTNDETHVESRNFQSMVVTMGSSSK